MHEKSLPAGDRSDSASASKDNPVDHQAALVVQLEDGTYFKAWRNRAGSAFSVRTLSRARLFSPCANEILERTIAKLRRNGIAATVVEVKVLVGQVDH